MGRGGGEEGGGQKSVSARPRPSTGLFLSSIVRLSGLVLVHLLGCVCTPCIVHSPAWGGRGKRGGGGRERETQSERERERQTDGEKGGYSHGNKKFKSIVVIVTLNPPIHVVISRNWMNKIFGIFN